MELTTVTKRLEDAAYIVIGAGVLSVKSIQKQAEATAASLAELSEKAPKFNAKFTAPKFTSPDFTVDRDKLVKAVTEWAEQLEETFEPVVDRVEELIPAQARENFAKARKAAKDRRAELRQRVAATTAA